MCNVFSFNIFTLEQVIIYRVDTMRAH